MSEQPAEHRAGAGRQRAFWLFVLLGLCAWVAWRLGAFDLTEMIRVNGEDVRVPDVYAWVDHPFHATRAHQLLESLRSGEILRWVGSHQGGYPVEFYPLGMAWFDVVLWTLFLGTQSIVALHKLGVVLVFMLPAVAYWMLARGDRVHPGVAVLATAIHFAVPGTWLNGGYTELVDWGLVTNVAGAYLALIASVALARYVMHREHVMGVVAVLAAFAGAVTNPRSLFALVIASVAILAVTVLVGGRDGWRTRAVDGAARIAIVGILALLLAAPVVFALFRYNSEYFFLHYQFYDPLSMFWDAAVSAVSLPILLVAIVGAIVAIAGLRVTVSQAMAVALGLYTLFTVWVATSTWVPPLVEQLEAPRLMPYQRQLMIWFAALAVGLALQWGSQRFTRWNRLGLTPAILAGLAIGVLVVFVRPLGFVPQNYEGLFHVGTVSNEDYALFVDAVEAAEEERVEGTSIFVIGNREDWWHHQLWAPVASDAPFYYDDWMWYWTATHQGPYDYRQGHYFPNPSEALTREYFDANGISVVVITDMWESPVNPREAARTSDLLDPLVNIGVWDLYTVREPAAIITNGDAVPASSAVHNERLTASFEDGDGHVVIRRNWFPRWEVLANGEPVEIVHRDDGYMEASVPPGPVEIEVRYTVTAVDWIGRIAAVAGIAGTVAFALRGRALFVRSVAGQPDSGTAGTI